MTAKTRRFFWGAAASLLFHGIVAVFLGLFDFSPAPPRPPVLTVTLEQGSGGSAGSAGGAGGASGQGESERKGGASPARNEVREEKSEATEAKSETAFPVREIQEENAAPLDSAVASTSPRQEPTEEKILPPSAAETIGQKASSNVGVPGEGSDRGRGETGGNSEGSGSGEGAGKSDGLGSGGGAAGEGEGSGEGSEAGAGGGMVTAPRLLHYTTPPYPPGVRDREIEGSVYVKILVSAEGTVEDVALYKSSGNNILDAAAMEEVYQWQFAPAKNAQGAPVAAQVTLAVNFVLY